MRFWKWDFCKKVWFWKCDFREKCDFEMWILLTMRFWKSEFLELCYLMWRINISLISPHFIFIIQYIIIIILWSWWPLYAMWVVRNQDVCQEREGERRYQPLYCIDIFPIIILGYVLDTFIQTKKNSQYSGRLINN